ncbi:hypothetical protein Nepgr_018304 [Nepenthes gracilis]|uniref:Uncharacterized protein n=1 Tax=Nepenthes gracilis TaxID=150966 RepID=A0AAD3SS06_NEPGR|nr:hypothetical protein Nepgr_018304 [Nepenthes gracilis]
MSRKLSEMDSWAHKPGEFGVGSGIPEEHLRGRVLINSPVRAATQQGSGKVRKCKINFLSLRSLLAIFPAPRLMPSLKSFPGLIHDQEFIFHPAIVR